MMNWNTTVVRKVTQHNLHNGVTLLCYDSMQHVNDIALFDCYVQNVCVCVRVSVCVCVWVCVLFSCDTSSFYPSVTELALIYFIGLPNDFYSLADTSKVSPHPRD